MVKVRFTREGNTAGLTVSGHAGYAPIGQDIVCAAVSMLSLTAAARISALEQVRELHMQEGSMELCCTATPQVLDVLATIRTGFELLADRYPSYISLTGAEERPANTNGVARQRAGGKNDEALF